MKTLKKGLCVFLVVVMCLTSAPLNGFVGMEFPNVFSLISNAFEAVENAEDENGEAELPAFDNALFDGRNGLEIMQQEAQEQAQEVFSKLFPVTEEAEEPEKNQVMFMSARNSNAQEEQVTSGDVEESENSLSWDYEPETKTLTVSGEVPDFSPQETKEGDFFFDTPWFDIRLDIEKLVVSEGVTRIGNYAFVCLENLTEVSLPSTLKVIGLGAFTYNINLKNIDFSATAIKSIEAGAFSACFSLEEIILPEGLEEVGEAAFSYCTNVKKLTLPSSLSYFDDRSFEGMLSLEEIESFLEHGDILLSLRDCGLRASSGLETIINNSSETYFDVDFKAFDDIKYARAYVFMYSCSIKFELNESISDTIGTSFGYTQQDVFKDIIEYSNENLGTDYELGDEKANKKIVNEIGTVIETHCLSEEFKADYCTVYCAEGSAQHSYCRDTFIKHRIFGEEEDCVCFEAQGFAGESVSWYFDPSQKALIFDGEGEIQFEELSYFSLSPYIEQIIFAEGSAITGIGSYAFALLKNVTEITIPEGVTYIGSQCFYNSGIRVINLPSTLENADFTAFYFGTAPVEEINVAEGNPAFVTYEGSLYSYETDEQGNLSFSLVKQLEKDVGVFPENTVSVGSTAFENYKQVKEITLPETVVSVGEGAFIYCVALETVNIGKNATEINNDFVIFCNKLKAVNVDAENEAYTSVDGVLYNKDVSELIFVPAGIEELILPETVEELNDNFDEFLSLRKITFLNPDCYIEDYRYTIDEDVVICGYKGSTADYYARKYNREFVYLDGIEITSIEIDTTNAKTEYYQNEYVDKSGITATVNYSDGTSETVTDGFVFTDFSTAKVGETQVTVTYRGASAQFTINVKHREIQFNSSGYAYLTSNSECLLKYVCEKTSSCTFYSSSATYYDRTFNLYDSEMNLIESKTFSSDGEEIDFTYSYEAGKTYYLGIIMDSGYEYGEWYYNFYCAHNYTEEIISQPTCGSNGEVRYTCSACGNIYTDTSPATGKHVDEDGNKYCDSCSIALYCGENITWSIDENGVLTIIGSGEMTSSSWRQHKNIIKKVVISEGVTRISDYAFSDCYNLEEAVIPASVTAIGDYAFEDCYELKTVTIASGSQLDTIGDYAFGWCNSLKEITIPASVTVIDSSAFYSCDNLETVIFEEGSQLETIGDYAFLDCNSLKEITIPASVISIGDKAFSYCDSLESVTFEEGSQLETIGESAFYDCDSLKEITIPASVTEIYEQPFCSCNSLVAINVEQGNTAYTALDGVLYNADKTELLQYPANKESAAFEIPASVEEIREKAFEYCRNLETVTFEEGSQLDFIDYRTFAECDSLKEITIPAKVEAIYSEAFYGCDALQTVNFEAESQLSEIGEYVFAYCYSLENISFGAQLAAIEDGAFVDCDSLKAITIPASVSAIGSEAFMECGILESVIFEEGIQLERLSSEMFSHCTSLKEITIPASVKYIDNYAFNGCSALKEITIPEGVDCLGNKAFVSCENLEKIIILNPELEIHSSADAIVSTAVIHGYANSTAKDYAERYGRTFVELTCPHENAEEREEVAPTCTKAGNAAGVYCAFCKTYISGGEAIEALGHELEWIIDVEPTCETDGLEVHCCSRCETKIFNTVVCDPSTYPETPHEYSSGQTYEYEFSYPGAKKLVLKFSGKTETESYCDRICIYNGDGTLYGEYSGTELTSKEIELEGDSFKITLSTDGSVTRYGFSFDSITAIGIADGGHERVLPALGHNYETTVTDPTCTEDGYSLEVCTKCGSNGDESKDKVEFVTDGNLPRCTGSDYTDNMYRTFETVKFPGAKKLVVWFLGGSELESGCDNLYVYEGDTTEDDKLVYTFTGYFGANKFEINADSFTLRMTTDGSVQENGFVIGSIDCYYPEFYERIPATGHNYGDSIVITPPTCTEDGVKEKTCANCSDTITETVTATGHIFDEENTTVKLPTCTDAGSRSGYCINCKESFTEVIPATGHSFVGDWTVVQEISCTVDGIRTRECEICGQTGMEPVKSFENLPKCTGSDYCNGMDKTFETFTVPGASKLVLHFSASSYLENSYDKLYVYSGSQVASENHIGTFTGAFGGYTATVNGDSFTLRMTTDGSVTKNGFEIESIDCYYGDGYEVTPAYGHSYGDWNVTIEPTCTSYGSKEKTCSSCNDVVTESISSLGHDYTEWTTKAEPTCTENGYKERICRRCQYIDRGTLYAPGHSYGDWTTTAEPTCTETGSRERVCGVCQYVYTEVISALGHSHEYSETIEATCTQEGTDVYTCTRCDDSYSVSFSPRHKDSDEDGFCDFCKEPYVGVLDLVFVIDTTGSMGGEVNVVKNSIRDYANRLANSNIPYYIALVEYAYDTVNTGKYHYYNIDLDFSNDIDEILDGISNLYLKNGGDEPAYSALINGFDDLHWGEDSVRRAILIGDETPWNEPTSTTGFRYDDAVSSLTEREVVLYSVATGGSSLSTFENLAAATGGSYYRSSTSSDFANIIVDIIDGIPESLHIHTYDEQTTEPTCTNSGSTTYTCTGCGKVLTTTTEPLGHDYSEEWTTDAEPTCENPGSKSRHCSRCNSKTDITSIDALGHAYGDWTETKAPECALAGEKERECSVCGDVEQGSISPLGHDYSDEWTTDAEPTCENPGSKSRHCSRCDSKTDIISIDALGHNYESSVTEPTCDEMGYTTHVCSVCDDTYKDAYTDPKGHTYGDWAETKAPECENYGKRERVCEVCGDVDESLIDMLGHDYSEEWTTDAEPTCENPGSKSRHCSRCDSKIDITSIDAPGHSYESKVTEPTCTEGGYTTYTCTVCSSGYTDALTDALGHSYSTTHFDKDGTKDGYTLYECVRCDDEYTVLDPAEALENILVTSETYKVSLSWLKAVESSVTGYRILRKGPDDSEFVIYKELKGRNSVSFVDRNLTVGETYYYKVCAMKGEVEGLYNEPVSGIPLPDTTAPRVTKLDPTVSFDNAISGKVNFVLDAVDDVATTGYKLFVREKGTEEWLFVEEKSGASVTVSYDTTASKDGIYEFKAIAYDEKGNVDEEGLVRTYMTDNTGPSKIVGLTVLEVYASTATLSWSNVPEKDAHHFILKRLEVVDGVETYVTVNSNITRYSGYYLEGLVPGEEYTYIVAAVDIHGNVGEYSDPCTVFTTEDNTAPQVNLYTSAQRVKNEMEIVVTTKDDHNTATITIQGSTDFESWTDLKTVDFTDVDTERVGTYYVSTADKPEGKYYMRVVATDSNGNVSDTSKDASCVDYFIDKTAPAAPSNVRAYGNDGYVEVKWDDNKEDDRHCYYVYRSLTEDGEYTLVASGIRALNWADRNVTYGGKYYYKVKVNDLVGNVSGFSATAFAEPSDDSTAPVIISMAIGEGDKISENSRNLKVKASDNNKLSSLVVEYKFEADEEYKVLINETGIQLNTIISSADIDVAPLTDGDTVTVRAYCTDASGISSEQAVKVFTVDKTAPSIVDLTATENEGTVTLSWRDASENDLVGFYIYRADESDEYVNIGSRGKNYSHSYSFTDNLSEGTYTYRVDAVDNVGNTGSYFTEAFEIARINRVSAQIEAVSYLEEDVEEIFKAVVTSDLMIASYEWDFGDGTTSQEENPVKAYEEPGDYTVTLTVTDVEGNIAVATKEITVKEREMLGQVRVKVCDSNGRPISNQPVYFDLGEENQFGIYTDTNGCVVATMTAGMHYIGSVSYTQDATNNYLPDHGAVNVLAGETVELKLTLVKGDLITGDFNIREITDINEIKALGISPNDPNNRMIYEVTARFIYRDSEIIVDYYRNDKGILPGTTSIRDGGGGGGGGSHGVGKSIQVGWVQNPQGLEVLAIVDVTAKISYLKPFYVANLSIANNASAQYKIVDCNASLDMSKASGVSIYSYTPMAKTIAGQQDSTATWILRGDVAGEYEITANFDGKLDMFNLPVTASFTEPIKVRGVEETISVRFETPEYIFNEPDKRSASIIVEEGDDVIGGQYKYQQIAYYNVGMTNICDVPVFYPSIEASANVRFEFLNDNPEDYDYDQGALNMEPVVTYIIRDGVKHEVGTEKVEVLNPGETLITYFKCTGFHVRRKDPSEYMYLRLLDYFVLESTNDKVKVDFIVDTDIFYDYYYADREDDVIITYTTSKYQMDKTRVYDYSDSYFNRPSRAGAYRSLANISLGLATAGYSDGAYKEGFYAALDADDRSRATNILKAYRQLGFEDERYHAYNVPFSDYSDKVACSMARKYIVDENGELDTLVLMVIRGGNYGSEWTSNFHVGDGSGDHIGFATAARGAEAKLQDYVNELEANGLVKGDLNLWMTSYSRGAATTNLVAHSINSKGIVGGVDLDPDDMFVYTYATPMGAMNADQSTVDDSNIFNFVSPLDVVPRVALKIWEFGRYGNTIQLPIMGDVSSAFTLFEGVKNIYAIDPEQINTIDFIVNKFAKLAIGTPEIYQRRLQDTAMYAMSLWNSGMNLPADELAKEVINFYLQNIDWDLASFATNGIILTLLAFVVSIIAALDPADYLDILSTSLSHYSSGEKLVKLVEIVADNLKIFSGKKEDSESSSGFFSGLGQAHYPAHYMARLSSGSGMGGRTRSSDIIDITNETMKIIEISSSVDVNVYDRNNKLVVSVVNGDIVCEELPTCVLGETNYIILDENDYRIETTSNTEGTMDYTVKEYTDAETLARTVSFYDVPVAPGVKYEQDISSEIMNAEDGYSLVCDNKVVENDFDTLNLSDETYKVTVRNGYANVEQARPGEIVTIFAELDEENLFEKWISEDKVSFDNETIAVTSFVMPDHDTEIIAAGEKDLADDVSLEENPIEVFVGEEIQLETTTEPESEIYTSYSWSSSDETVITVDENGIINALKEGTAKITVTEAFSGCSAELEITVTDGEVCEHCGMRNHENRYALLLCRIIRFMKGAYRLIMEIR